MDYPIYIDGAAAGTLRAEPEGLYTRFTAALPARPGLWRIWLCGGGESRSLGLLSPEGDRLSLSRRLSRALRPPRLERVLALPAEAPAPSLTQTETSTPSITQAQPAEPSGESAPALPADWRPVPGGLYSPSRRLLALPCALRRPVQGVRTARIGGSSYLVFRL